MEDSTIPSDNGFSVKERTPSPHYGKMVHAMAKLSGRALKDIAREAGYTEQGFYYVTRQKHLSTKTIEKIARVCERSVSIKII